MADGRPAEVRAKNAGGALEELVARGLIAVRDREHLERLLAETGESLDQTLCKLGLIVEDTLADFYAEYYGLQRLTTERIEQHTASRVNGVNPLFLERRRIFLLENDTAAVVDLNDGEALHGLSFALGRTVTPVVATASEIERLWANGGFSDAGNEEKIDLDVAADADRLKDLASGEPAVRLVNRLIGEASRRRASDIHLEPGARAFDVRLRVDGVLFHFESLSLTQGLSVISRLKILSNLDIAERRRPQDGRFSFPVAGRAIDLRISTTPTVFGEGMVLRLLERSSVSFELTDLGFEPDAAQKLKRLIRRPSGVLLLTGPTGSGKTTTLYALLKLLANGETKILTIEDPVEYQIDGVSQTQANPAIGLTFAQALRSFLRHDPDVIMVGEMRDLETARIAVQASLTGHLVLSTLHTNDAPSAVARLLDIGVEDYLVASTLIGVVGQRLVRRICADCGGDGEANTNGQICLRCAGTGYRGRLAIAEVLEADESLKASIKKGSNAADIRSAAHAQGFKPMSADGEAKVKRGLTSASEIEKALGA